jgi:hypothetical protein
VVCGTRQAGYARAGVGEKGDQGGEIRYPALGYVYSTPDADV